MSEFQNVIQIKRGAGQPKEGILHPYELGYDTTNGYLYIGDDSSKTIAQKIKAGSADQLSTEASIRVDLSSTSSASFNGTKDVTPGVSGALAVGNGGTGLSSITTGSYLVGNGLSAVILKTPTEVRSDIGALGNSGSQTLANGDLLISDSSGKGYGYELLRTVNTTNYKYRATANASGVLIDFTTNNDLINRMILGPTDTRFTKAVNIASGGTGATTASDALANLGALPVSGGSMTNTLHLGNSLVAGHSTSGMNCHNSDIVGVNGLYFSSDAADVTGEGICFYRSNGNWDVLYAQNGALKFQANQAPFGSMGGNEIVHTGNHFTLLASGKTLNTSSTSFTINNVGGYSGFIFYGTTESTSGKGISSITVPAGMLSSSDKTFTIGNAADSKIFKVKISSGTMTVTNGGYLGAGIASASFGVYGIK